jgi:phage-related protein
VQPLELFKLFGTIAVNNSEANQGIDETTDKAEDAAGKVKDLGDEGDRTEGKLGKAFSKMGSAAVAVGKTIATGLAVASTAVVAVGKAAISSYADYEQLVGGVETLFDESSATVIANAQNAYKTAGMSANEYMETVTSFSASLLQSLGGDTKAAADKADMAITDMSDNANKMGTSIEMIQNAYNGFAKQNYTMLDNLKLGYGGTKEEMQRLLDDASKLSGIEYDISSYSDIVDAIHIVQNEMGITGTTAKEASSTISGSLASAKASWQNLLTGIADGNQDVGGLITQFFDSIVTVADNIVPRIAQVMGTLPQLITDLVPKLLTKVSELIDILLPVVVDGAVSLLNAIVQVLPQLVTSILNALPALISGIEQVFYAIVDALPQLMTVICEALPVLIPQLVDALVNMIVYLATHIAEIIQPLIDNLPEIIIAIVNALMDNLPALIEGTVQLVIGIVQAIPQIIMALIEALPTVIQSILEGLWNALPLLLEGIISIVGEIGTAIWDILSGFFTALGEWFGGLWESIKTIFAPVVEWFGNLFSTIWNSIVSVFSTVGSWVYDNIIAPVANFFKGLWEGIVSAFHTVIDPWIEIIKRAATLVYNTIIVPIKNFFTDLWNSIVGIFSKVSGWFTDNIATPIKNIFSNIWNAMKNGASNAWEGIKSVFSKVTDWFKNIFSKAWQAVKNVFSTGGKIFDGIKDGIVNAFKTVVNAIIRGINKVIKVPFDGINWALEKIRGINILGVEPFGWISTINTPQIPELEKGGVLKKGQVGLLEGKGDEAVVPLEKNTGWIRNVATQIHDFVIETKNNPKDITGNISSTGLLTALKAEVSDRIRNLEETITNLIDMLKEFFPELLEAFDVTVVLDDGTMVARLTPKIDRELGKIQRRKEWG